MTDTLKITYGQYFIEVQEVPWKAVNGVLLLVAKKIDEGLEPAAAYLNLCGYEAKVWRTGD